MPGLLPHIILLLLAYRLGSGASHSQQDARKQQLLRRVVVVSVLLLHRIAGVLRTDQRDSAN